MNKLVSILFIMLFIGLLSGCSSSKQVTTSERTMYVHKTDTLIKHDSINVHDSVSILIKGDTIITDRWHVQYRERYIYSPTHDTIYIADSVNCQSYPLVNKSINRTLSDWLFDFRTIAILVMIFLLFVKHKI